MFVTLLVIIMYTSATGMIYIIALVSFLIPLLNYSFSFLRPVHIFIPSVLPQKTLEDWGCVFLVHYFRVKTLRKTHWN
jgi:hypothetical protein